MATVLRRGDSDSCEYDYVCASCGALIRFFPTDRMRVPGTHGEVVECPVCKVQVLYSVVQERGKVVTSY
jgi:DNA-directed RNA polymerase subunit RPC12/RpoP